MEYLVFVYGSLMRGFGNHVLLKSSEFISQAECEGFELFSLGSFPGAVAGREKIKGELYRVSESTLEALDRLEGHPTFYERTPVTVTMLDGSTIEASLYIYQGNVSAREYVPNGDWRNYHGTSD